MHPKVNDLPGIPSTEIRKTVTQHGFNSHSYLTLYGGFHYFTDTDHKEGVVAFADTPRMWVAGAEPFCEAGDLPGLFEHFAEKAKSQSKGVLFIPVRRETAKAALKAGYGCIRFGCEPLFDLERYTPTPEIVSTAALLHRRGAKVTEFRPEKLNAEQFQEMDFIRKHWIDTRSLPALKFMNQADPWILSKDKRYFACEFAGQVQAFVAAIPYANGTGWYFIDVLRRTDSKAGATELLVLEAMRLLKRDGAKQVSLGIATLSGLSSSIDEHVEGKHKRTGRWLSALFSGLREKGDIVFRFKPLHRYKMKFQPTSVEPVCMVYYPPRFRLKYITSILYALFGKGFFASLVDTVTRTVSRLQFSSVLRDLIKPQIVPRSIPDKWYESLSRIPLTSITFIVLVATYLATNKGFDPLSEDVWRSWGFTIQNLYSFKVGAWIGSALLHETAFHLIFNLLLVVVFTGGIELILGTKLAALCMLTGLIFTNPIFGFGVLTPLIWLGSGAAVKAASTYDVGISLGIVSCLGGLAQILRHGKLLIALAVALIMGNTLYTHDLWQLNHLVALGIGYVLIRLFL